MKQIIISILFAMTSLTLSAQQSYVIRYSAASHNPALISLSLTVDSYCMDDVIIDSGSTTTQLTYTDYVHLKNSGYLTRDSYIGSVQTRNCNGQIVNKPKYRLKTVKLGTITLNNVDVIFDTVNKTNNIRLLGLNFLNRFSSVNVDFNSKTLTLALAAK